MKTRALFNFFACHHGLMRIIIGSRRRVVVAVEVEVEVEVTQSTEISTPRVELQFH